MSNLELLGPNRDSEKYLEKYLGNKVKLKGGRTYKFVSPGWNGMPDRIVCMPIGKVRFVEVKSKGKVPSPIQKVRIKELRALGFQVDWIDNFIDMEIYVESL